LGSPGQQNPSLTGPTAGRTLTLLITNDIGYSWGQDPSLMGPAASKPHRYSVFISSHTQS